MSKFNVATLLVEFNEAKAEVANGLLSSIDADIEKTSARVKGLLIDEAFSVVKNPKDSAYAIVALCENAVYGAKIRKFFKDCGFTFNKDNALTGFSTTLTSERALKAHFGKQKFELTRIESSTKTTGEKAKKVTRCKDSLLFVEGSQWEKDLARFLKGQEKKISRKAMKCLMAVLDHFNEKAIADFGQKTNVK